MTLKLSAGDPATEAVNHGRVALAMGGEVVEIDLTVPDGKVSVERLLPILQGLTNFLVDRAEAHAAAEGRQVTCAKGCGACCRQIVPVSQAEARALGRLVAAMPEPRRSHVRQRFQQALSALEAKGLLAEVDAARTTPGADAKAMGLRYFKAGVACPFLEEEACSIHPDRPLACRQYLVTSAPAHCADPAPGRIVPVPVPSRPSTALLLADTAESGVPWLPLVYALIYHDEVPEPAPTRTAPEILQDIFARLKHVPPPEAG
ncbi:MAG: hypothetical protein GC186_20375 [Rhodobacteraceae bacterium]|nr:hypothetical protein [Paracoccaceae bacterium]